MIKFLLKLWELNRPYRGRFLLGIFFGVLAGVAQLLVYGTVFFVATVLFSTEMTDVNDHIQKVPMWVPHWIPAAFLEFKNSMIQHTQASEGWRVALVALIPLVVLMRGIIGYLNCYLMSWVAVRTTTDLRAKLFEHLLNLPLSFFTRTSTGELMSRNTDIILLQNMIAMQVVTVVQAPVTLLTCLVTMLVIRWDLMLISALVFPLCVIPISIYSRKGRQASVVIQSEYAALGRVMHESFTGNRIIKAYNLEGVVVRQFAARLDIFRSHFMRVIRATETPGPLIEFVGAIGIAGMFIYMGRKSGVAELGVFIGALLSMYPPIKALIRLHSQMAQAQGATERVFDLLATPNTLRDPAQPKPLRAAGAEIHFDDVSFDYGEKVVLHNIQLKVKPGQMIALVGPTGSGKTTVTNLLLRFYDPTSGAIRIGDTDLREVAMRDLRSQIAVVTQDIILFNDTIRNNIACGRPGASAAEVELAARHAHAHEFIMEKAGGYEAEIGEKGIALSGGQKQRLSIARAILKNAPILVLDEATSSLDNEVERMVQVALDELMEGRTTFCIAHRLSTVQHADRIVVLDHGRIVEEGKHADLLARGGLYHKLHGMQFHYSADESVVPSKEGTP